MTRFEKLPEGCIATILSRTTPVDACRLSLVSNTFRSVADSDAVWNKFLPSDSQFMNSIISNSPSLSNLPSKKALYLALSDRPIIIENGVKSFQLDRKSGKICYMLGARAISIDWAHDERYWEWTTMPNSRFPEVAELLAVCWLEFCGTINTIALSPNTEYAAYLVFKMVDAIEFQNRPVEFTIFFKGGQSTKKVCLDPNMEDRSRNRIAGLECPNVRSDGWLEIEMGKFFNSGIENEQVQMKVLENGSYWKSGLILEGIEVRPKCLTLIGPMILIKKKKSWFSRGWRWIW